MMVCVKVKHTCHLTSYFSRFGYDISCLIRPLSSTFRRWASLKSLRTPPKARLLIKLGLKHLASRISTQMRKELTLLAPPMSLFRRRRTLLYPQLRPLHPQPLNNSAQLTRTFHVIIMVRSFVLTRTHKQNSSDALSQ